MNSLLSVLIVDDEPEVRQGLRALLAAHSEIQVVGEAASVTEALVFLQNHAPDILFLDMELPGGSGLELERSLGRATRTVFVTAYPDYALKAFQFGAVDYLLKPVDPDRLALTIERLRGGVPDVVAPVSPVLDCMGISGQIERIRISEILWIEAFQNYTRVYLAQAQKPVLRLMFSKSGNRLYATAAGRGFTRGAPEPEPPVQGAPEPGRLPTTSPPVSKQ